MTSQTYHETCEAARAALREFYESSSGEFVLYLD